MSEASADESHEVRSHICSSMISNGAIRRRARCRRKRLAAPWHKKVMHAANAGSSIANDVTVYPTSSRSEN